MTDQSSIFPAFIRAEYDGSGSGFALFEKEAGESAARARRQFEANFAEVERVVTGAVSRGLKTNGAMDLGVEGYRQAAANAKVYEMSLRNTRDAAQALAASTDDTSASTRSYLQALNAQVTEATRARQEADAQVTTYSRLQAGVDALASRNSSLAASYREVYAEQARAAREEVQGRRAQEGYNGVFAPGLTRSATSSGAGFEALEEQARNLERLGQAAATVRGELDPMYAAQQRFNQALDTADDLLKQNIIDERLHAAAVQHARDQLQAHSNAIHAQEDGFQRLTRSSGVLRQAYIQTGQQGQDLVISLIGGQKASVVFAQQLPQLAFALSGLGMQADGTQKGIGRIATLLAGPWGVAFAGAAFGVGLLVEKLWQNDEASKAAEDAAKKHASAVEALNEALERSVHSAEDKARADFIMVESERLATIETLKRNQALLAQAKLLAENAKGSWIGANGPNGAQSIVANQYAVRVDQLEAALKENQKQLDRLTSNSNVARGNYQTTILDQMRTAEGRTSRRYEILINDAKKDGASATELERLSRARDAEIEKIRETEKASRSAGTAREKEAATVGQISKLLLSNLPGTVTSGARSAAENQRAGGSKTSYHLRGQAVDFVPAGGMGSVTKAQIRAVFEAAGVQLKELLGPGDEGHKDHFHIAWSGGKNQINSDRINDQLAREAERKAAEAQRAADELDRAAQTLFSRFDEGRAAALGYADSLEEINRLLAAGKISPDDAMRYQIGAAQQKSANDNQRDQKFMDELDKALWGDRKRPTAQFTDEMETNLRRAAEASREILYNALRQLDAVQQVGGPIGNAAGVVSGIVNGGDFYGVNGALGKLLNLTGPMVGEDGWKDVTSKLDEIFGGEGKFQKSMTSLLQGSALGMTAGGMVLGQSNNKITSSLGGALGKEVGSELTKNMTGLLGKLGGPLGSIAGGILGGAIGSMFSSPKWGTATVTGNSDNDVSVGGNKSAYRSNAGLAGTSIQSGLDAIAEQFGADVGGYNVSIGQYKGKWRVSTTGRTGKLKGGSGRTDIKDFGEDGAEDAIKYAIADAVKDGALEGLRASTQALLAASEDVEAQLQKALDFEDVFSRLKSYKDPVGAALDTLDKEFKRLEKIFEEAGASTEEYAQLEELYGIERAAAVKEAAEKVTASLQSLFDDLTVGNDARSLRDRMLEAQANYDPLAQRVAAGDTTAYDDYADAAQQMLEIQRQIYGSGEEYFKMLDEITALTKTRIDAESNIASISEARPSLFASDTSLAPVVSATESQTATLVAAFKSSSAEQTAAIISALGLSQTTLNQISAKLTGSSETSNNLGTVARANF